MFRSTYCLHCVKTEHSIIRQDIASVSAIVVGGKLLLEAMFKYVCITS